MTRHDPPRVRCAGSARDLSIFLVGASAGLVLLLCAQRVFPPAEDADVAHYLEVRRFVLESFVDEIDPDRMVKSALKGMIDELDGYSQYYDEGESRRIDRETRGTFTGIGVVFRGPIENGEVLFPLESSPADEAGLRVGDRILAIDERSLSELPPTEIRARLGGEPDSVVVLRVVGRDGEVRTHSVRRRSVLDPTVRHARLIDEERGIGYMALLSFSHETPGEFDRAFEWLERSGMRGLVLDLRGNPGGVLSAAVDVARRFVESGLIVSTRGRTGSTRIEADRSRVRWAGFPLVVLVDGRSASASEVLAGALQDHRAAVLVGSRTHGKGMVQTICRYPREGTIAKITTSHYYTPSDRNLERDPAEGRDYGIVPDLEVPISEAERLASFEYSRRYGPPLETLAALEAWEREEARELIDEMPSDPQLEAALDLLRGRKPAVAAAGAGG